MRAEPPSSDSLYPLPKLSAWPLPAAPHESSASEAECWSEEGEGAMASLEASEASFCASSSPGEDEIRAVSLSVERAGTGSAIAQTLGFEEAFKKAARETKKGKANPRHAFAKTSTRRGLCLLAFAHV